MKKKEKMLKYLSKIFFTISIIIFAFTFKIDAEIDNFEYQRYHVDILVRKDGVFEVKEDIDVAFKTLKHGITLSIPTKYDMDFGKGNKTYYFPITDIKANQNIAEIIDDENGVVIYLGKEDSYASSFENYQVSYKIHSRDLKLDNQIFYYNLLGKNPTLTHNFSFKLSFEDKIDFEKIQFFNQNNDLTKLKLNYQDNSISGVYEGVIGVEEAFTTLYKFDSNYFDYPKIDNKELLIFTALNVAVLVYTFIFYRKHGKDKQIIETVEFTAPKGLSSIHAEYILNKHSSIIGIQSLFFELARKNYIVLNEVDGKIKIIKTSKNIGDDLSEVEIGFYNILFKNFNKDDSLDIYNLSEKTLISLGDLNGKVYNYFKNERSIYDKKSIIFACLMSFIGVVFGFIHIFLHLLSNYYIVGEVTYAGYMMVLALISIPVVIFSALYQIYNKKILFLISILASFGFVLTFYAGVELDFNAYLLGFNLVILAIQNFLAPLIVKRTDYGNDITGKILGLKNFIIHTDYEKLQGFVKENPYLYYDILPYAYAFGLTNLWSNHFKNIEIIAHSGYVGFNGLNYIYFNRLTRGIGSAYNTSMSKILPKSSSGGFKGGSFGGGFSGGGFGGSRGGSW